MESRLFMVILLAHVTGHARHLPWWAFGSWHSLHHVRYSPVTEQRGVRADELLCHMPGSTHSLHYSIPLDPSLHASVIATLGHRTREGADRRETDNTCTERCVRSPPHRASPDA